MNESTLLLLVTRKKTNGKVGRGFFFCFLFNGGIPLFFHLILIDACVTLFALYCFAIWKDYTKKGLAYCVEHYATPRLILVAATYLARGINRCVVRVLECLMQYRMFAFMAYWCLGYPATRVLHWWKPDYACGFRTGCGCGRNYNWLDRTGRQLQFMGSSCAICHELYRDDVDLNGFAPLGILRHCCHVFHEHCLLRHLRTQNDHGHAMTCPICRRDVIGNKIVGRDYTPDGRPHAHTAVAQFERMQAQIRRGRDGARASGIRETHLVYVVRNNPLNDLTGTERTMGYTFGTMQDAIDACRHVLEVNHLHRFSLHDVRVVDGRSYANVAELITNPDAHAFELMRRQPPVVSSRAPSTRARRPPRALDL
jgi:hypothetical protein